MEEPTAGERTSDPRAAIAALHPLLGIWRGTGRGHYPNIEAFEYVEELQFTTNGQQPLIHYFQKTWRRDSSGAASEPLHSESGFFRATPSGMLEISNAQDGGRVEVLRGVIQPSDEAGLVLHFESIVLAHDERMLRTRRTFVLSAGLLRTTVEMATRRTPELQPHLEATLTKTW